MLKKKQPSHIYYAIGKSQLGYILLARTALGICAISLADETDVLIIDLQKRFPKAVLTHSDLECQTLLSDIFNYFTHPTSPINFTLDSYGSDFQESVWQQLRQIPVGQTLSYRELARRIGNEKAVRAVANACAANPLAIITPCHRAVRANGALSGFRWGVEKKKALLTLETEAIERFGKNLAGKFN